MIRKLRLKFILVSMLSVTVVLVMLIGIINVMNYRSVVRSADRILTMLSAGGGRFPGLSVRQGTVETAPDGSRPGSGSQRSRRTPRRQEDFINRMARSLSGEGDESSPELRYESRFFSVIISPSGEVKATRTDRISAVNSEDAAQMGMEIYNSGKDRGFKGEYRYRKNVSQNDGTVMIIFYDCGRSLGNARSFLLTSIGISLICLLMVYILIAIFSKAVIRPAAEAYEKQRRFITDAGHELKTPLAIINADADVLEMEIGESESGESNEWLEDIRKQTAKLTDLTGSLIYLAKTEEGSKEAFKFVEFPMSDVVAQEAESFKAPVQAAGKKLETAIEENLALKGDQRALRQLVGILIDNAIKYSADESTIVLNLKSAGRNIELSVSNDTKDPLTKENIKHLFDRFYRSDSSRNSQTGGHGIGLSIAKSIVEGHNGKISAASQDGTKLTITAVLPS